ncbi:hypothetical protein AD998_02440 [bacterium 336/3]|nr:hypothetical protein AD998_02440 [bacterium 336/3]
MKNKTVIFIVLSFNVLFGCSERKLDNKGFPINNTQTSSNSEDEKTNTISKDSVKIDTRPSNVLLTGISNIRLTTIYKVNINKNDGIKFIGSNKYLSNDMELERGNNWNGNYIPGLKGIFGYNLVNVSHYDILSNKKKDFFDKPVLIKTLYYPTFSKDTLNNKIIKRNYFLVSVYNDDTNKDKFINQKDLRRFYLFNSNGDKLNHLVPENYSVFKSEYDLENDFMYVFAKWDKNANGQIDDDEPINIFWINLKDPNKTGLLY